MAFRKFKFLSERCFVVIQDPSLIMPAVKAQFTLNPDPVRTPEKLAVLDKLLKEVDPLLTVDHYTDGMVIMATCEILPGETEPRQYTFSIGFYDNLVSPNMTVNAFITAAKAAAVIDSTVAATDTEYASQLVFSLLSGDLLAIRNCTRVLTTEERGKAADEIDRVMASFEYQIRSLLGDVVDEDLLIDLNSPLMTVIIDYETGKYDDQFAQIAFFPGVPLNLLVRDVSELDFLIHTLVDNFNNLLPLTAVHSEFTSVGAEGHTAIDKLIQAAMGSFKSALVRIEHLLEINNSFIGYVNQKYNLQLPQLVITPDESLNEEDTVEETASEETVD